MEASDVLEHECVGVSGVAILLSTHSPDLHLPNAVFRHNPLLRKATIGSFPSWRKRFSFWFLLRHDQERRSLVAQISSFRHTGWGERSRLLVHPLVVGL